MLSDVKKSFATEVEEVTEILGHTLHESVMLNKEIFKLRDMLKKVIKSDKQILEDTIYQKDQVIEDLRLELQRQGSFLLFYA